MDGLSGAADDAGAVAVVGTEGVPADSVTLAFAPSAIPRASVMIATIPARVEMIDLDDSQFGIKNG